MVVSANTILIRRGRGGVKGLKSPLAVSFAGGRLTSEQHQSRLAERMRYLEEGGKPATIRVALRADMRGNGYWLTRSLRKRVQ